MGKTSRSVTTVQISQNLRLIAQCVSTLQDLTKRQQLEIDALALAVKGKQDAHTPL